MIATAVGYSGGDRMNPSYGSILAYPDGHSESTLLEFDPRIVSFGLLVRKLLNLRDGTIRADRKPNPNTTPCIKIFYRNSKQESAAKLAVAEKEKTIARDRRLFLEILPAKTFWMAEPEHQQRAERTTE